MNKPDSVSRYWDSRVFLGCLTGEYDQNDQCNIILTKAAQGKTLIFTSAITVAEVSWLEPLKVYPEKAKQSFRDLFDYPYIQIIDYTRFVAEQARELKWEYGDLDINDACHLSTVIESEISLFETHDLNLLKYDGEFKNVIGQTIRIAEPFISPQFEISF